MFLFIFYKIHDVLKLILMLEGADWIHLPQERTGDGGGKISGSIKDGEFLK
jgi:hypothetical protein